MSYGKWWWQGGGRETEAQGQNYRGAHQDPGRGLANGKRLPGIRRKGNSYAIESLESRQLLTASAGVPDALLLSQSLPSNGQFPPASAHTTSAPASSDLYVAPLPLVNEATPSAASPSRSGKSTLPSGGSATLDAVPPANAGPNGGSRGDAGANSDGSAFVAIPPVDRPQGSDGAGRPRADDSPPTAEPDGESLDPIGDTAPVPKSIEDAIEIIERTIKKLKDASSDGKDDTLDEVARRAKVIADAGGYRRPDLEQMPDVYRQALEDLETNNILTLSSGLQWARYYVIPGEGWDEGVGDAWMRMEAQRLELLRRRIEVIQGKLP